MSLVDFPLPQELLKDPSAKPRRKRASMTLRESCRALIKANRKRLDAVSLTDATCAEVEFQIAMRDLERLTSDDAPPPQDLAKMCKGILMAPYGRDA